ncbi:hypothetical protein RBB78_25100 (plasmid) [Tunturiibacter empetritectus]|uniref:hypothetical protein n=1 Tax=Tunturiibacter empetritectus TaxID=3069691 RepID=UPI003D9B2A06
MGVPNPLSFHVLDDLALADAEGLLHQVPVGIPYGIDALGPLMEFLHLASGNRLPHPVSGGWVNLNGASTLIAALESGANTWIAPKHGRFGFAKIVSTDEDPELLLTNFFMNMKRAAQKVSGIPSVIAGQLVGALGELKGNILDHSGAPETGIVVYRSSPGLLEFVAADRGIGVLSSLRSQGAFPLLTDYGEALSLTLQEGTSCYGVGKGRGFGFRTLFLGLLNLNGLLRFRSGDHALVMDGTSPNLASAQLIQKAFIDGFLVSVRIQA